MNTLIKSTPLVLIAALGVCGCGGPRTAAVSGTVTYNGKPVTSGRVNVLTDDLKEMDSGAIDRNGNFSMAATPIGRVKICVENPQPAGLEDAAKQVLTGPAAEDPEAKAAIERARTFVAIPAKYADPTTSELTATIKSGTNELKLDLK